MYYNAGTLDACNAAPNYETYKATRRLAIRFVPGIEPSSDWYEGNHALTKRASRPVTHVTYGKNSLNYGSLGASGTGGVIHHLYDACGEVACDSCDLSFTITTASDLSAAECTLILHPQDTYNGWKERNIFIEAMVAAAGHSEKCEDKTWMNRGEYCQSVLMHRSCCHCINQSELQIWCDGPGLSSFYLLMPTEMQCSSPVLQQ